MNQLTFKEIKFEGANSLATLSTTTLDEIPINHPSKSVSFFRDDATTTRGRLCQSMKIMILILLPCLGLFVESCITFINSMQSSQAYEEILDTLSLSSTYTTLVHQLQLERSHSVYYVASNYSRTVLQSLIASQQTTNKTIIHNLQNYPQFINSTFGDQVMLLQYLHQHRIEVVRFKNSNPDQELQFYSDIINPFLTWINQNLKNSSRFHIWQHSVAYHSLLLAKEQTSYFITFASLYYVQPVFDTYQRDQLVKLHGSADAYFKNAFYYSSEASTFFIQNVSTSIQQRFMNNNLAIIYKNQVHTVSIQEGGTWLSITTVYLELLQTMNVLVVDHIHSIAKRLDHESHIDIILSSILLVVVFIACPILIGIMYKTLRNIQLLAIHLSRQTQQLQDERARANQLLYQMLPKFVANQLKQGYNVSAETFEDVTIYFSDIVGFTVICHRITALQVVQMLNILYEIFDSKVDKYNAYKIETVGDAYMVASGLPRRIPNRRHASEIADLALDLQSEIQGVKISAIPDQLIRLRAGIHTGPCAAGVVGNKMPRYCLFGDTVNIASRMESHGKAAKIHLSKNCKKALDHIGGYVINVRGHIAVKVEYMRASTFISTTRY
uniref:NIT domain GCY 2 n=1 Tax=Placozoa sp. H4 TaxID=1034858 RepID=A0A7G7LKD1_9METZ|nr:NIT domain GCY 2 [Placozoa sp. H4]